MEIIINNQSINFSLEHEKNAFEVMNAISQWLNNSNNIIETFCINGKEEYLDSENLKDTNINEIKKIEVKCLLRRNYALKSIFELKA